MCQPAPLARCSNHAQKQIEKLEKDYSGLSEKTLAQSYKITELKSKAREAGIEYSEISDENSKNPKLAELNATRRAWEQAERDKKIVIRDIREQELHMDATPKMTRELRENPNAYTYGGFRRNNAEKLQAWRKGLKAEKDSNGNPILSKEADPQERQAFYTREFAAARKEYSEGVALTDTAHERLAKNWDEMAKFETKNELISMQDGSRYAKYTVTNGSKEDQEEVDYLTRRRVHDHSDINRGEHQQILARAKMNSIKAAVKLEKKKAVAAANSPEAKKASAAKVAQKREEQAQTFDNYTEDLDKQHRDLTVASRADRNDSSNESLRKSAKASVVGDAARRLKEIKGTTTHEHAVELFREEMTKKHAQAKQDAINAQNSKDDLDYSINVGAQGGYSLVLDKVRSLK